MSAPQSWWRQAISDGEGLVDIAYISIGLLTIAAIASLTFIFTMSAVSYFNCQPSVDIGKGETGVIKQKSCEFDPLPAGQAAGLIFGAYAALITALAAYMAATKRSAPSRPPEQQVQVASAGPSTTTVSAAPAPLPIVAAKTSSKRGNRR